MLRGKGSSGRGQTARGGRGNTAAAEEPLGESEGVLDISTPSDAEGIQEIGSDDGDVTEFVDEEEVEMLQEFEFEAGDEVERMIPRPKVLSSKGKRNKEQGKKGRKTNRVDGFDFSNVSLMVDDFAQIMNKLGGAVEQILPLMQGKDQQMEKKEAMVRLHNAGVQIIEAQEKVKVVPDAIMAAYNNLDLEELVTEAKDDAQFLSLLKEFGEAANKEVDERKKEINMKDHITPNETYQEFLEVLHKYRKRNDGGEKGEEEERPEPLAGPSSRSLPDLGRCSEGIEALTEYLPVTDPFTRKILKNPFVNKFCGHVYEYQSALDMIITSNCRTRCPYVGCTNKHYIQPEHLVKDEKLAARIAKRIHDEKIGVIDFEGVD